MSDMKVNANKLTEIVDKVWSDNSLYSKTYKTAALTAMQELQNIYEGKANEEQQPQEADISASIVCCACKTKPSVINGYCRECYKAQLSHEA